MERSALAWLVCAFFSAVLPVSGQSFESLFLQGTEEMRLAHYEAASANFEKCISLQPDFGQTYFNLGLIRFQQNRFDDAVPLFTRSLRLKPDLRGADLFLGIADYRLDKYADAVAALTKAAKLEPSNPQTLMWLGMAELAADDPRSAAAHLQQAQALKPGDVDILYHLGRAYMQLSKNTYERMYQADPKSWRVHEVLAESFKDADRFDDAIKESRLALDIKPDEPGLHQLLGEIYWEQNNLEKAEAEFEIELKIDPENYTAMYKLASIDVERSKPEMAADLLRQVLREHPESREARYQLGRAEAQLGDTTDAIQDLARVTKDPGPIESETLRQTYYQLSQLYRRAQRPEESRLALNEFARLKQEADTEQARKLQDKLKRSTEPQQ